MTLKILKISPLPTSSHTFNPPSNLKLRFYFEEIIYNILVYIDFITSEKKENEIHQG
jgi:hypothetical protein